MMDHHLRGWKYFILIYLPCHWILSYFTIGLRFEHILLNSAAMILVLIGPKSRKFSLYIIMMLFVQQMYDYLRYLVPLQLNVHVDDVYLLEKAWFGLQTALGYLTPNEFFSIHNHPVMDFFAGLSYFFYTFWAVGFLVAVYFKDRRRASRFAVAFVLTNLAGWATYIIFPLAPPWYVEMYGLGPAIMNIPPEPAGALRFDNLLGIRLFQGFYSRSAVIFGAMPSLHVAMPMMTFCGALGLGKRWWIPTLLFTLLVSFSAIYLQHHYILDVLVGLSYATIGYLISSWLHKRIPVLEALARMADEK